MLRAGLAAEEEKDGMLLARGMLAADTAVAMPVVAVLEEAAFETVLGKR